jgi:hypothetical protein
MAHYAADQRNALTVANVIIDEQRETIAILRAELDRSTLAFGKALAQLREELERSRRLLDALRVIDLQVLPEHIAKLVADWKAL